MADEENLKSVSITNPDFLNIEASLDSSRFTEVLTQLDEYFHEGRKIFDLKYELHSTRFREKVYKKMIQIPYGETITYKELAEKVGSPNAFRAVGTTCGKNPLPIIIPCHRITSTNGLGGFTGGLDIKKFLLNLERN